MADQLIVDPQEAIEKARKAVTERAELPGMSLMEHLEELRKRIVHSAIYLGIGFIVAYAFHERLYGFVQAPLTKLGIKLNYTHPMDPLNLYLQVSLIGGAISPRPSSSIRCGCSSRPASTKKKSALSFPS